MLIIVQQILPLTTKDCEYEFRSLLTLPVFFERNIKKVKLLQPVITAIRNVTNANQLKTLYPMSNTLPTDLRKGSRIWA